MAWSFNSQEFYYDQLNDQFWHWYIRNRFPIDDDISNARVYAHFLCQRVCHDCELALGGWYRMNGMIFSLCYRCLKMPMNVAIRKGLDDWTHQMYPLWHLVIQVGDAERRERKREWLQLNILTRLPAVALEACMRRGSRLTIAIGTPMWLSPKVMRARSSLQR